jgi:ribonuclease T1
MLDAVSDAKRALKKAFCFMMRNVLGPVGPFIGRWATTLALVAGLGFLAGGLIAKESARPVSDGGSVALSQLPAQGQKTYELIAQGGPFPYDKDGTVFGNRERLLPAQKRGYYREYTVKTPALSHRGAKRIVCGGVKPSSPEVCYYTEDHYASFRKIVP